MIRPPSSPTLLTVQGKALTFWDVGDKLDLEYSPDEISQALAVGPYIRRDADNAA